MKFVKALNSINYRLFFAIFATMLLPSIYQTVRIYFLGNLPNDWGINIASQLSWVNLFYEVIQEALILPLFFLLGKSLNNHDELENKIRTGLFTTAFIYTVLSALIFIFAKPLVNFMAQNKNLTDATVRYIRIETIAALFSTLWRFLFLVFITLKKDFFIYILLGIQTGLSIILDTFLVSTLPVSLNLGVNGIAISNIIANVCILAVSFFLLSKDGFQIFKKTRLDFSWLKEWFSVGKFSGIESFLRNFAFMMMVVRMVNVVSEQGNYWVANNFIWNWLLLPALSLADVVKKEVAENQENIKSKTFGYICLSTVFALIWIFSIPLWKPFLKFVINVAEYETVFRIALIETGFYITFIFNTCIFDATFYGLGKTNYMLIQSVCIDVIYYGIMFILYCERIFVPTLTGICLMFGIGMTLDFIPAAILYAHLLKKLEVRKTQVFRIL